MFFVYKFMVLVEWLRGEGILPFKVRFFQLSFSLYSNFYLTATGMNATGMKYITATGMKMPLHFTYFQRLSSTV